MQISFGSLPPKTRYISKNLIIGARQNLAGLRQLKDEEAVTQIIDLRNAIDFKKLKEFLSCKLLGLRYKNYPIQLQQQKKIAPEILNEIQNLIQTNKDGNTFVHCNSGIHRSLLIAALNEYLNGNIRTLDDYKKFLTAGNFYNLRPKSRLGLKIALTPNEANSRTANLEFQKDKLWEYLTTKKK